METDLMMLYSGVLAGLVSICLHHTMKTHINLLMGWCIFTMAYVNMPRSFWMQVERYVVEVSAWLI